MKVSDVARIWQASGVSVIPILDNQTKRPAFRWSPYQVSIPSLGEVDEWWGNGKPYGLALICGAVSGNLEMTEIEGRALDSSALTEIANRMDEVGAGHIWDLLNGPEGYSEMSPSGGIHLLYRISDHEVPGNTKIASNEDGLCLSETRGHGGYVIVAPTPGICHPSGESWDLLNGGYGKLPLITWAERNLLHQALYLALDKSPAPPPQVPAALPVASPKPTGSSAAGTLSPGNDFEASTDWQEILEPHGWSLESRHGTERHWTRPGKRRQDGASATTGRASDRDRLYVFSSSTVFDTEIPYTKFGAYALLNHGGDHHAAARELVRLGFGERREVATLDGMSRDLAVIPDVPVTYTLDETGNAERLWEGARGRYHWVHEEKRYRRWDGKTWVHDFDGHLTRDMIRITEDLLHSQDEYERKWGKSSRSRSRLKASVSLMSDMEGCTKQVSDFDPDRHLLNVQNGVLNLKSGELVPHDSKFLMTRMFGASYDPMATCEHFQSFMEQALPDATLRTYVQRALGYSLLGDVDQRSIFWIYGPPGTGKSTLMDTMRYVFGEYGLTAPAGAFRAKLKEHGPSNDLHGLMGKRFVTTSETAESTSFDEDLLKRLSGRDQVTSRALYQDFQEWTPECVLWMATNNAPKFNSDDDAIWRRTKLIPFLTAFVGEDEVSDMARTVLAPERDGILNWLLAGLRDYLEHGLGEPESILDMANEQRIQSDSVARFLDDKLLDGVLVLEPGTRIRTTELYAMYGEWARMMGEKALGTRRFTNRVASNYPKLDHSKIGGHFFWQGLGRDISTGILGTFHHDPSD